MLKIGYLMLMVVVMFLLAACSSAGGAMELSTTTQSPPDLPDAAPQAIATDPVATEEAAGESAVDYCLECHTDQQRLIDTADPEEEVINENKGEG